MLNNRSEGLRLIGVEVFSLKHAMVRACFCILLAYFIAYLPAYEGLSLAACHTLFIVVLAAGLWLTESIPAFAVSVLIIGLEIMLLSRSGINPSENSFAWVNFVAPWASPLIWLFLAGLLMAEAANKTGLDRWLSFRVLKLCGSSKQSLLLGVMTVTFVFSMFMSNTATAAMMLSVVYPIIKSFKEENEFSKALILSIPFAANIGGMGSMIGTPPNAIAVGLLSEYGIQVSFLKWMIFGLPPALLLLFILWAYLVYKSRSYEFKQIELKEEKSEDSMSPLWQRIIVMIVFTITILLWLTGSLLHNIPTAVVAFIPIVLLTLFGVIDSVDLRKLQWDVLLLLAGGLALGVAVTKTGLAEWLVSLMPEISNILFLSMAMALFCCILSNFMSNTAAANILIPIMISFQAGSELILVIPMALAASAAMCLPISTPPNAIAFASGKISAHDFIRGGVLSAVYVSLVASLWIYFLI